ncbi:MAG: hypothetical protein UFA98_04975 [Ruminococcus sp.]|nr:hypothetical protein [Ruminococcus sp.]
MKKLYENIEDIYIEGNPENLTELITDIDNDMQAITNDTEQLTYNLIKYSEVIKGIQFKNTLDTVLVLSDTLSEASRELNRMQNEIVEYQNRIFRFEEMNSFASVPNKYIVERVMISADSLVRKYEVSELISLVQNLNDYSLNVSNFVRKILDAKDNVSAIWRDSQFSLFSDFIDDICVEITNALKKFDAYAVYLDEKIKELN